ncbi:MAG: hypothetical protein ACJAXH_002984, partial [Colwellia sp.]
FTALIKGIEVSLGNGFTYALSTLFKSLCIKLAE